MIKKMKVLQVILPIYFSLNNLSNGLTVDVDPLDFSEISIFGKSSSGSAKGSGGSAKGTKAPTGGSTKSSGSAKGTKAPTGGSAKSSGSAKGTKAPTGGSAKSSKAPKGTKAPEVIEPPPEVTDPPVVTGAPTGAPTALCIGSDFFATFDAPKQSPDDKGIKGSMKGVYLNGNKVDFKLTINFGDRTFNKVKLNDGDLLDWSINTKWENPDVFGWNNKCRTGRVGKHHDRSVACSPLSENIDGNKCTKPNGSIVRGSNYNCIPSQRKDTCERGDLSGKLGPLVVTTTKNGFPKVQFKGTDNFFLKRRDAELAEEINEPFSIVISKNGENFICAQFILICDNKL